MTELIPLHQYLEKKVLNSLIADELAGAILDVSRACCKISSLVRHGSLLGNMAAEHGYNVQEESQKKLDIVSNEILIEHANLGGHISAIASEEEKNSHIFSPDIKRGPYILLFDPLDGSTNIEVNGLVGTIFSFLPITENEKISNETFLQPGTKQVCAGYCLYGISTELVLTVGDGIKIFTLNPETDAFMITKSNLVIPKDTSEYAINASNQRFWEDPFKRYISECNAGKEGERGRDFNMRWAGAMVGDVHRVITRGGLFAYPIDEKVRKKGGRLRLMYEGNPMSMLVEQAGGLASTGYGRIMNIQPQTLHQRVPVILGSKNEVQRLITYHTGKQ